MKAIIWSKNNCPYCVKAKAELTSRGIEYEERILGIDWTKEQLLEMVPNAETVPQIFLDGTYVGGYNQLKSYPM
jgi:glutaredoxin